MKELANESDMQTRDLFKTISQQGLKKEFNVIDEKAETLEVGEQYQIQSYTQKVQSAIQNLIESYTNGKVSINDSRDLLGKYNELSLYLNTKVKYGSLSIREQNIINKEIENIVPLVQELQFLAERLDLSYASVYKQLYENLKMYKYTPITMTKETKDKLIKKTRESYNIKDVSKTLEDWREYLVRVNMASKYLDPFINDSVIKAANTNNLIVDFGREYEYLLDGSGMTVANFKTAIDTMKDIMNAIDEYNASSNANDKRELSNTLNSNLQEYTENLDALEFLYNRIQQVLDQRKSTELLDIKQDIEDKKLAQEMERLEKARLFKYSLFEKRRIKQEEDERARLVALAETDRQERIRLLTEKNKGKYAPTREQIGSVFTGFVQNRESNLIQREKDKVNSDIEKLRQEKASKIEALKKLEKYWADTITVKTKGGLPNMSYVPRTEKEMKVRLLADLSLLNVQLSKLGVFDEPEPVAAVAAVDDGEDDDVEDEPVKTPGKTLGKTPKKKGRGIPVKRQQSAAQLAWRKKVKDCMAKYGCSMKEALQKLKKK